MEQIFIAVKPNGIRFKFYVSSFKFQEVFRKTMNINIKSLTSQKNISPDNLLLNVMIRDRSGLLYEGEIEAFSSYNDKGPFDVLGLHTNFISLIKKGVDLRLRGSIFKNLPFEIGVMKVKENKIEVYIGIIH